MTYALAIGGLSLAFAAGVCLQRWRTSMLCERLHYLDERVGAGDIIAISQLEDELHQTQRRVAGLLASPRLYLRARRLLGPLELDREDLTAELVLLGHEVEEDAVAVA